MLHIITLLESEIFFNNPIIPSVGMEIIIQNSSIMYMDHVTSFTQQKIATPIPKRVPDHNISSSMPDCGLGLFGSHLFYKINYLLLEQNLLKLVSYDYRTTSQPTTAQCQYFRAISILSFWEERLPHPVRSQNCLLSKEFSNAIK